MLGAYRRLIDHIGTGNAQAMLVYGVVHALAVALGHAIADPGGSSAGLWPALGIQAAFLIIAPTSRWLAMLAAAVLVEGSLAAWQLPPASLTVAEWLLAYPHAAIGATTATLLAAAYRRLAGRALPDARVTTLVLVAILVVLALDAAIRSAWLRSADDTAFLSAMGNWYITDLLGVLAAGVPVLTWWFRAQGHRGESAGSGLELAVLSAVAVIVAELMFTGERFAPDFQLPYLLFPILLWAATRYHPSVVATLTGLLTIYIVFLANHVGASGAVVDAVASGTRVRGTTVDTGALLPLQLFLGMLLITTLVLSVALNERRALNRRLRELSQLVATEQQRARQRFAIDLRNGIDGSLATIEATLGDACSRPADPQSSDAVHECRELVTGMRRNVHELAEELVPADLGNRGLVAALERMLDRIRREHAMNATCKLHGALDSLPPERAVRVLRVAQELLLNVAKHAGVQHAALEVRERGSDLEIEVRDEGRGFDPRDIERPAAAGFGLLSIRDQVEDEGGSFEVRSAPGAGCRVRVQLARTDPAA